MTILTQNTDQQLIFLTLYTIMQIFVDELPEGDDPARAEAIKDMAGALKHRVEILQQEAKVLQEAQHETSH